MVGLRAPHERPSRNRSGWLGIARAGSKSCWVPDPPPATVEISMESEKFSFRVKGFRGVTGSDGAVYRKRAGGKFFYKLKKASSKFRWGHRNFDDGPARSVAMCLSWSIQSRSKPPDCHAAVGVMVVPSGSCCATDRPIGTTRKSWPPSTKACR